MRWPSPVCFTMRPPQSVTLGATRWSRNVKVRCHSSSPTATTVRVESTTSVNRIVARSRSVGRIPAGHEVDDLVHHAAAPVERRGRPFEIPLVRDRFGQLPSFIRSRQREVAAVRDQRRHRDRTKQRPDIGRRQLADGDRRRSWSRAHPFEPSTELRIISEARDRVRDREAGAPSRADRISKFVERRLGAPKAEPCRGCIRQDKTSDALGIRDQRTSQR